MTATITPAEREAWSERAAILEFEAGLPRAEAERRALEMVVGRRQQAERQRDLDFAASGAR